MRRMLLALVVGGVLLSPSSAGAELDEIAMTSAEIQAFACARYHQMFVAYDLEFLVPDLREVWLESARAQGASGSRPPMRDAQARTPADRGNRMP